MTEAKTRANPMTVFTPGRPGLIELSRFGFWLVNRAPWFTRILEKLSFIHFAQWSFLRQIPFNGSPQRRERLRYTYLLFESNFNGTDEDYLDTFGYVIPGRIWLTWTACFGFPGPTPTQPFREYVAKNDFKADYYYSAYPQASTAMILSSLRLQSRWDRFQTQTADVTPEQFAVAYREFVRESQRDL